MDPSFEPESAADFPSKSSAKYRTDFKVNQEDGVTEGYYSKSKQLPMHTDVSILDASAIDEAKY